MGWCHCESERGVGARLKRQSPEQNAAPASACWPSGTLVGVTIHPLPGDCHTWFLHWSSAAQNEWRNGVGAKRLQFLHTALLLPLLLLLSGEADRRSKCRPVAAEAAVAEAEAEAKAEAEAEAEEGWRSGGAAGLVGGGMRRESDQV